MEENLIGELDRVQSAMSASQSRKFTESSIDPILANEVGADTDVSMSDITEKLEVKKKELLYFIFPFDSSISFFLTVILLLVVKDCLMLTVLNGRESSRVGEKMPIAPIESVWGALLTGCRIHGKTKLAAYAVDRVFELGSVSPGMNVLLSNAYAAAGRWEDAAKARKMLRDRGVKKETSLSWVKEGNRVHTFAAGDTCHVRTKEIYQKLEELGEEMKKAGYVPDTSFVLREVDVDEKNWTIKRSNLGIT